MMDTMSSNCYLRMAVRSKSRAVSELIEDMFDESRYNSRARPGADSGEKDRKIIIIVVFLRLHLTFAS